MAKLIYYIIFPGLIFSTVFGTFIGLIACWVDRKVTARIQWRVGPPLWQNFIDIAKLLGKETILPQQAKGTFLIAPFIGFISLGIVAAILNNSIVFPGKSFLGDLIVVLYLLMIPAISLIIGASSSRNPLASIGASREMKLSLSYELPLFLAIISILIRNRGVIQLGEIIDQQAYFGSNILSWSGALAFIVAILCMQGKLGFVPFDMSEAEQEIMGGVLIEYSGLPLAIFKLSKALLLYIMPIFLIILFMARDLSLPFVLGKYILLLVITILIKNTNPRLRIDQAMKFFWGPATLLAIIAVVLAMMGL